ncbi:MAG: putative protein-disulfide isomerase [Polaribacter sp.]|jgi:putative protein-disulfide isomerase
MENTTLIYVHDPMCSWCFGFSKTLKTLLDGLPASIKVTRLLGGLAPDSSELMPEATRNMVRQNWQRIEQAIPGVLFNYDFWDNCEPRRATYPACRAVIAARQQGDDFDDLMTRQIHQAYYQQARNPSDDSTLIELAAEIGLDQQTFSDDLTSNETQQSLQKEIDLSRSLGVNGFPSLVVERNGRYELIHTNYTNAGPMLSQIEAFLV